MTKASDSSDRLDDVVLDHVASAAFEHAAGVRHGAEPLDTIDLLSALATMDGHGAWEQIWLETEVWDLPARLSAYPDPPPAVDRPEATYREVPLSPATAQAFRLLRDLRSVYDLDPVPPGALALALLGDPTSGAARALLDRSAVDHGQLLDLVQSELLGVRLPGLAAFLAASEEIAGADERPAVDEDLDPGQLMMLVLQFVATPSLSHAQRLVEEQDALLSAGAAAALEVQLSVARENGPSAMLADLLSRRYLLRRCDEIGVEAAFLEARADADTDDPGDDMPESVQEIGTAIMRFVGAQSWEASRRVLDALPILLTDRADAALDVMIDGAGREHPEAAELLRRHQELLRRCRQVGIDAAFAELDDPSDADEPPLMELVRMYVIAPTLAEAQQLLTRWPRLVTAEAVEHVEAVMEIARREGSAEIVTGLDARLARLRAAVETTGPAVGGSDRDPILDLLVGSVQRGADDDLVAELVRDDPDVLSLEDDEIERRLAAARRAGNVTMTARLEQLQSFHARSRGVGDLVAGIGAEERALLPVMFDFIRADTWTASRRIVESNPALRTDAADALLDRLLRAAERTGDDRGARTLSTHRRLLRQARETGVAEAFAELTGPDEERSVPELLDRVREAHTEMDEMGVPPEARIGVLGQAAAMFVERFQSTAARDALDAAVDCWRWAVELAGPGSGQRVAVVNNLATTLTSRFAETRDAADLVAASDVLRAALAADELTGADRAGLLTTLGNTLLDLATHTGDRSTLDQAVVVYETAVVAAGHDADNRTGLLVNLSEGLHRRFDRGRNGADLEDAITALRDAVASAHPDDPLLPGATDNLAVSLVLRFDRTSGRNDLDEALAIYRSPGSTVADHGDSARLGGYAGALTRRFALDRDPNLLDEAEHLYGRVAATTPRADRLATSLAGLADVHRNRYRHTRDRQELDTAVEQLERAEGAAGAGADRAMVRSARASTLVERHSAAGHLPDLDNAIDLEERALLDLAPDSAGWASTASSLGNHHLVRAEFTAGRADLDDAVAWSRSAVHASGADASERPRHLAVHGLCLRARYQVCGDVADLEQSVVAHSAAVGALRDDDQQSTQHLIGWGQALLTRFQQAGDTADLDLAIVAFRRAVARPVLNLAADEEARAGLAACLRTRSANSESDQDLDEALNLLRELVAATMPGSPHLPGRLVSLANGLGDRYDRHHRPADRARAVELYRAALHTAPPTWRDQSSVSISLADTLLKRSVPSDGDIEESIRLCADAVQDTDERSPDMPQHLAGLAAAVRRRGSARDVVTAAGHYRRCCELAAVHDPRSVLVAANVWGDWAATREAWSEMTEAYGHGARVLRMLVGRQASRRDKVGWMRGTRKITAGLTYARAMLGDAEGAVVAMERGRALLLTEKLGGSLDDETGAMTISTIAAAAGPATVGYLVAASPGGMALLVSPDGTVTLVRLPELSSAALRERTVRFAGAYVEYHRGRSPAAWDAELDDLGHWLWTTTMGPVLDAMPPGVEELVLVPGGYLGLLPLHAACTADVGAPTGRRYVIDAVRVSYCASAMAYAAARRSASTLADSILVIEEPRAPGAVPMPKARAEADHVLRTFAGSSPLRDGPAAAAHLRGADATRTAVMSSAGDHAVLHLCCHAFADATDPLDSALLMAGGELLTVADLTKRRDRPARLAVLSACESAMQGAEIPDEVLGFPTGLTQAGVGGVVGTQWTISDAVAARIIRHFYTLWREEGIEPAEALRQAQRRIRDRARGLHPSGWAAMTYTGA